MEGGETAGSLALSLGLEPGARFTVVNPPEGLGSWFSPLPDGVVYQEAADTEPLDFALLFRGVSGGGDGYDHSPSGAGSGGSHGALEIDRFGK